MCMDIEEFIKSHTVCIVFFTNHYFVKLNKQILNLSIELDTTKFKFVDSINDVSIIEKYNINSVPLVHIYKNGGLIEELFGNYSDICTIIRLHF